MATKKAADHTLYHLSPKGFWKKFRDAVVVSPSISSGLPLAAVNRYPQPASRPEKYATPATKASNPAENPYWKRDVRRAAPSSGHLPLRAPATTCRRPAIRVLAPKMS
ncbi:hypothetical protein DFH11DRAFT_1523189 [Phellopilus nigrolimitatus]|nr:hypothetical protein DFH11DRAFT_1523189 [Phellopilus nigrolimitatus]